MEEMIGDHLLAPIVLDARNPGAMTGAGNHTYLLASNGAAVLVDAGVGQPDHLVAIERALSDTESSLQTVLVTHSHPDHVSGVPAIANAHPKTLFAKYAWPDAGHSHDVRWRALVEGDDISVGDESLKVVHTPGHSPDHLAFWHDATRGMYTGDLVIAGGSVMIEASRGGSLTEYLASLQRVLDFEPRQLFPAHGPQVDDPSALIHWYLQHRRERERQIIAAIEAGRRTVEAIAESIYDGLEPRLMAAARENVRAHLEKLAADGVAADRDGWRIL
jgi:glyoxylase-like metal-dependent hydrolase (beta-lactamase superfamily II)